MGVEIERKFLLRNDVPLPAPAERRLIRQGYLRRGNGGVSVRVRQMGDKGYLTVKGPKGNSHLSRLEYEYEIPLPDALEMLSLCKEEVVEKERLLIPYAGMTWEVDLFLGANEGLRLAEIELPNEETTFLLPPWIATEVTGQDEYYNAYLSRHPYSSWGR